MTSQTSVGRDRCAELIKNITDVRLEHLNQEQLRRMHEACGKSEARELLERAEEIHRAMEEDKKNSDAMALIAHQQQAWEIEARQNELSRQKRKIYTALQRVIMRNGVIEILRPGGYDLVNKAMLVTISVVLGVMFWQFQLDDRVLAGDLTAEDLVWKLFYVDAACCTFFLAEFGLRLIKAEDKRWFWRTYWIDFVSSIPVPPVPMLLTSGVDLNTLGRGLRFVRILRLWRAFRIVSLTWRGVERLQQVMDVRLMKKSIKWVAVTIFGGAVVVFMLEQAGEYYMASIPRSLWWSFNTVATGGFGDLYLPTNPLAQLMTAVMILSGLVVMGVFIATLSAAFRGAATKQFISDQKELHKQVGELRDAHEKLNRQLDRVEGLLARNRSAGGTAPPGGR